MTALKKTLCALLTSISMSFAPIAGAYDLTDKNKSRRVIDDVKNATVCITKYLKVNDDSKVDQSVRKFAGKGSGILLCDKDTGRKYVLTVSHVLPTIDFKDPKEKKKYRYADVVELDVTYTSTAMLIRNSPSTDLALLYAEGSSGPCFKGKIGSDYEIGDFVFTMGYEEYELKQSYREGVIRRDDWNGQISFSGKVNPGNSGGPLVALDKGLPVLVGIVRSSSLVSTKSNEDEKTYVIARLSEWAVNARTICGFLKNTAVHDDYCEVMGDGK